MPIIQPQGTNQTGSLSPTASVSNSNHTHNIGDVGGLVGILNSKAEVSHLHNISTIVGLPQSLSTKADLIHTHDIADISGIQDLVNTTISPLATTTTDGFLSAADKAKLDSISSGAGSTTAIAGVTGLQDALDSKASASVVTTTTNGLMIAADKVKLNALNSVTLLDRSNHTGVQAISTVTGLQTALDSKASASVATTTTNGLMISTDKVKLDGIAANATANSSDAVLKDRANHTGAQAISTVTGLQTALDSKYTKATTGIPKTDLDTTTQASLTYVDTLVSTTIPELQTTLDGRATSAQGAKADTALQNIAGMQAAFVAGTPAERTAFRASVLGGESLRFQGTRTVPISTFNGASASGVAGVPTTIKIPANTIIYGQSRTELDVTVRKNGTSLGTFDIRFGPNNGTADTVVSPSTGNGFTATTPQEFEYRLQLSYSAGKVFSRWTRYFATGSFTFDSVELTIAFNPAVDNYLSVVFSGFSAGTTVDLLALRFNHFL
jgi:hypothetical protein